MSRSSPPPPMLMKLGCALLVLMFVSAPLAEGFISCSYVAQQLLYCIPYLSRGAVLSPGCCSGIRSINAAARTTTDRRTACICLKTLSSGRFVDYGKAASLPGRCGVAVPYPIGPGTDCSRIR